MKKVWIFTLFAVLLMSGQAYGDAKSSMLPVLQKAKAGVLSEISAMDKDLAVAARKLSTIDFKSSEARNILSAVCKGRPYIYDCGIMGPNGKLAVIEPEKARKDEGEDVSFQPQVKKLLKAKSPVLSKVFTALDGVNYVNFLYPIFNAEGKFLGALSLLVRHDQMFGGVIAPIVRGQPYDIWVMQTDGVVLYDPDKNQINRNIFTDPMFEPFDSLILFSKTMAVMRSGSGSYSFYKKGFHDRKIVDKAAVWDTVGLYKTEWRIVATETEK